MNVFSAFTLGSLMKSVVPGSIIYMVLAFCWANFKLSLYAGFELNGSLAIAAAFVFSILFGFILNTIVFTGLNNWLVRKRCDTDNRFNRVLKMNHRIDRSVAAYYMAAFNEITPDDADSYSLEDVKEFIDVRYLLQVRAGAGNFGFLKEDYWFWLEFQINLGVAVLISAALLAIPLTSETSIIGWHLKEVSQLHEYIALGWLIAISFFCFCVYAARRNFERHNEKRLSLIIGAFVDAEQSSGCRETVLIPNNPRASGLRADS